MKKITFTTAANEEAQTLYFGIPEVYGEYILTTAGDPITAEDADDQTAELVDAIISGNYSGIHTHNGVEDCTDEDAEYFNSWLEAWGIR